jgi:ribosomal protein L21E
MDVEVGDRVRIDIPNETDADHNYHGEHGTVIRIFEDDANEVTGDSSDSVLVRIKLETGEKFDFRSRDLRPPID